VLEPTEFCRGDRGYALGTFADANLTASVEWALGAPAGEALTCARLATLEALVHAEEDTRDIAGVQNLIGLRELYLGALPAGGPTDLAPLSGLSNLTDLRLNGLYNPTGEPIDVAPLGGLTRLSILVFDHAFSVEDITPLCNMTGLRELVFNKLGTGDISAVAALTGLTLFAIMESGVNDVSPLVGLTELSWLRLSNHPGVRDVQPLLDNAGLGEGDEVDLYGTVVSCGDVDALEARGVSVYHDCLAVATEELPGGCWSCHYSYVLEATGQEDSAELTWSRGELTWSLAPDSGPVPPGLTLFSTGEINGKPTEVGTWEFTVRVVDEAGRTAERTLTLAIRL
jgi:hypothetical protein